MRRTVIQLVAFAFILILTISSVQNPYTSSYVDALKNSSLTVTKMDDSLYREIAEKAADYRKEPQNAKVHKVWKAMPGYNGVEVDIKASYEKLKQEGEFIEEKLVFKEISPEKTLDDLPPAPIFRGHPDKPMTAFIINVAWGNEYIPDMLKILKKHSVKATFFLEGRWVKSNPDLAKMIVDGGHEIGNHSYSHPDMKTLSAGKIEEEIVKTNEVIEAVTGETPTLFGPPSGSFRDEVVEIAAKVNMKTVLWSVDTIDWKKPDPNVMVQRVTSKIHPGALVLMHPTSSTAQGLEALIVSIKSKQLHIGDVSTLLSEKRISSRNILK